MPPGVPGPDGQPRGPRVLAGILPSYTAGQIDASGGAGKLVHSYEAVEAGAMILLAASVFHFQMIGILRPEMIGILRPENGTIDGTHCFRAQRG